MIYAIVDKYGIVTKVVQGDEDTALLNTPDGSVCIECSDLGFMPQEVYYDHPTKSFIKIPISDNPFQVFDVKTKKFVYTITLDQAKDRQWEVVKRQRDDAVRAPIMFNGNLFDADDASASNIKDAILSDQESVQWITYDDDVVTLTRDDLKALSTSIANRKISIYEKVQLVRTAIRDATTIDEVFSKTFS